MLCVSLPWVAVLASQLLWMPSLLVSLSSTSEKDKQASSRTWHLINLATVFSDIRYTALITLSDRSWHTPSTLEPLPCTCLRTYIVWPPLTTEVYRVVSIVIVLTVCCCKTWTGLHIDPSFPYSLFSSKTALYSLDVLLLLASVSCSHLLSCSNLRSPLVQSTQTRSWERMYQFITTRFAISDVFSLTAWTRDHTSAGNRKEADTTPPNCRIWDLVDRSTLKW